MAQVDDVSGKDRYTVDAVPKLTVGFWVRRSWTVLDMEARSLILLESRASLRSSPGLRMMTTAAVKMAKMPMTINNSMSVKDEVDLTLDIVGNDIGNSSMQYTTILRMCEEVRNVKNTHE